MKKKLALWLACILALMSLAGCSGKKDSQTDQNQTGESQTETKQEPEKDEDSEGIGSETYEIEIYTNANGTSTYVLGVALADLINENSDWLKATAMESPGPDDTGVMLLNDENKQTHAIGYVITKDAELGIAPFDGPNEDLRVMATFGIASNVFLTTNPDIKTLQDLDGKRVALGTKPNIPRVDLQEKMFELMGVQCQFEYLSFGDGVTALSDGKVDALIGAGFAIAADAQKWTPNPALAELLARNDIYYLSYDIEMLNAAEEALGYSLQPDIVTVGPGNYDGNWKEELNVMADYICWGCHKNMPNEVVEEILRIMADNSDKFAEYSQNGGYITIENMAKLDNPEYIHEAAAAFYQERGVEVNEPSK